MGLDEKQRGVLHVFNDDFFLSLFCNVRKETYFYFKTKTGFLICSHDS